MKQQSFQSNLLQLEKKINLLNDKVDRLMEALGVELAKAPEVIQLEEEKKRKARERQQAKILAKENSKRRMEQFRSDIRLKYSDGLRLRQQFNLLNIPSADRIRQYQRTNNPNAFDGLKRNTGK